MSKLGYISQSYGKQFNAAIANTYGTYVLGGSNLPSNTIIISSPVSQNNDDRGSYSLLITDYIGNPVRLTYTIREGTGMKYSDDAIRVNIDNYTIIDSNNRLSADLSKLVDNKTVIYKDDMIFIDKSQLDIVSPSSVGLFMINETNIKSENNKLFVDTNEIQHANENVPGTVIGDGITINTIQGVMSVIEDNLPHATDDNYGFARGNGSTFIVNDGVMSILTENLDTCLEDRSGIVTADNKTIVFNSDNELTIDTQELDKATVSSIGVFKYDPLVFSMNEGILSVANYSEIQNYINNLNLKLVEINQKTEDIDYLLTEYKVGIVEPEIMDFHCANLLSGVLEKPQYLNQPLNEMNVQFITTDFIIKTNCPFIVSLNYEDNTDPKVALYSIKYENYEYYGNSGLLDRFDTTRETGNPLRFTFIASNYYKNDKSEFSNKVKAHITVSYADDVSINKSIIYSIVRFNSGYTEEIEYDVTNIEMVVNKDTELETNNG